MGIADLSVFGSSHLVLTLPSGHLQEEEFVPDFPVPDVADAGADDQVPAKMDEENSSVPKLHGTPSSPIHVARIGSVCNFCCLLMVVLGTILNLGCLGAFPCQCVHKAQLETEVRNGC